MKTHRFRILALTGFRFASAPARILKGPRGQEPLRATDVAKAA